MCLKNGFIISGTEKYENPIFIYVLIICVLILLLYYVLPT